MAAYIYQKPIVGVTLGDAAGIGPELVAKAAGKGLLEQDAQPVIIGDERNLRRGMETANVHFEYKVALTIEDALKLNGIVLLDTKKIDAYAVKMGEVSSICGMDSATNVRKAVEFCRQGLIDGICFGPNNKKAMKLAGFVLNGAIDLISGFFDFQGYRTELNMLNNSWTSRVTSHIPLREVSEKLTISGIVNAINLMDKTLRRAGVSDPRIVVAALNPHAGEGGTCGVEEIETIRPAVEEARSSGINAFGPLPADTLFKKLFDGDYDAAVTMFHDQGQIAMKLQGFDNGVTVMAGLPHPVTTCSHGTAFDLAGKGIANPGAWESAYRLAVKMAMTDRLNKV